MALKLAHQVRPTPKARGEVATRGYMDGVFGTEVDVINVANRVSHDSQAPLVVGIISVDRIKYFRPGTDESFTMRVIAAMGDVTNSGTVDIDFSVGGSWIYAGNIYFSGTSIQELSAPMPLILSPTMYRARVFLGSPQSSPSETFEIYSIDFVATNTLAVP